MNEPLLTTEIFSWSDMLRALWYFLKGRRARFLILLIIGIVAVVGMLAVPYSLGILSKQLLVHKFGDPTSPFYLSIIGIGILIATIGLIRNISRQGLKNIRIEVGYDARVEGFERLMNFSYAWHQEENSGVRVQRITTGVSDLLQLIIMVYRNGVDTIVSLVGIFSLFLFINWSLAAVLAGYVGAVILTEYYFNKQLQHLSDQENAAGEQTSGTYYESASNALTVKALGVKEGIKQSVIRSEFVAKERAKQTAVFVAQKYYVYVLVRGVGLGIFLALVAHQVFSGVLAASFFLTYYIYYYQMSDSAGGISDLMGDLVDIKAGIGRMMPIYWTEQDSEGSLNFPVKWKQLSVNNISFSYPGSGMPAVQNITMNVVRGQKIGIAGKSGEGKSTLAKLLLSLYKPSSGAMSIDAIKLQDIRTDERVHHISAVLQETELFSLSLYENITVFRGDNPGRMETAIKVAQLEELIAELPEGLDTQIGEKGYKLSGGQRQRIGIARALYGNSDIIVMDEATSSLDSITELAVQQGIERELGDRTLIMIAHRLSTLSHANVIYFVAKGTIVERGTFEELIAIPDGLFRQQYELQGTQ